MDALTLLRRYIDDPDKTYSDSELSQRLDEAAGSKAVVARDIWVEKMAAAASLVNVSEGGSSRGLGALFDRAEKMAAFWTVKAQDETEGSGTILRRIVR